MIRNPEAVSVLLYQCTAVSRLLVWSTNFLDSMLCRTSLDGIYFFSLFH